MSLLAAVSPSSHAFSPIGAHSPQHGLTGVQYPVGDALSLAMQTGPKCAQCGKPHSAPTSRGQIPLTPEQGGCACPRYADRPESGPNYRSDSSRLVEATARQARAVEHNTAVLSALFQLFRTYIEAQGADVSAITLPEPPIVVEIAREAPMAVELTGDPMIDNARAKARALAEL